MREINWGIIGLGNIAQSFSEGFLNLDSSNLLAISSLNKSKLDYFKNKYKIDENYIFKNYDDLLNCSDIDIVYIALTNNLHYEWILKAIKKNKRVLVEKPAFIKSDHAKIIKYEVLKRGLFFTEGYMYLHNPQILKIIKIIKNKELGKVISMKSSFCKNILTKKKFFFFERQKKIDLNHRLFNKKLGGGCILDLGCYPVSFSVLIASLIEGIDYQNFELSNVKRENGLNNIDIDAEAEINFDNSFKSQIKSSFKKPIGSETIITCEKGDLIIKNTWTGKTEIVKKINGVSRTLKNKLEKNIYSYEIENISKDILEGVTKPTFPSVSIDKTIINTEILESWLSA